MEVLVLVDGARGLVTAPPRAFAGVAVLEVDALEAAVPSCFVGDLVGDYNSTSTRQYHPNTPLVGTLTLAMLEGRDGLGTGLGLGAFMLFLLPAVGSSDAEVLLEPDAKLLGLFFAAAAGAAAFCFCGG